MIKHRRVICALIFALSAIICAAKDYRLANSSLSLTIGEDGSLKELVNLSTGSGTISGDKVSIGVHDIVVLIYERQ